jgi:two-component system cell cycle response regulator
MGPDRHRRLALCLLAGAAVSLVAVALRNLAVSPVWCRSTWDKAYYVTEYMAIAVVLLRARGLAGAERAAWIVLAAGLSCFAVGDVYYQLAFGETATPTFPSLADAGYLSVYPAGCGALVLLLRARARRRPVSLWLDGAMCGLTIMAVDAALVFGLVSGASSGSRAVATNLAYPLADLALLGFVVVIVCVTGRSAGATWRLLAVALGTWAIADTIYVCEVAAGSYHEYTLLDTSWPACYLLLGFAAWRPAVRIDARRLRGTTLVLPGAATLVALGLLAVDHYHRLNAFALWLACGAVLIAVLRFALTFRENLRMLRASETEASTDALTGLGNRRALMSVLDEAFDDHQARGIDLLVLLDLNGFKAYNDRFGHLAGDALLARLGRRLADAIGTAASAYRIGGDEFCVLASVDQAGGQRLIRAIQSALTELGEHFVVGCAYGAVRLGAEAPDPTAALRLADQRMYAEKRAGRPDVDEAVHQVLLRVAAEHDGDLRVHVDDVAELADAVAHEFGLTEDERLDIRRAAALHDIGKIAIPDAILHAPRALDDAEWEYMRRHTIIGERIIEASPGLERVARIVRSSHERYDGNGYPDRLAALDIPLGARIVAVCDTYDAIVTNRAYRDARTPAQALAELRACAGSQFDPQVVAAFVAVITRARDAASADVEALRGAA